MIECDLCGLQICKYKADFWNIGVEIHTDKYGGRKVCDNCAREITKQWLEDLL